MMKKLLSFVCCLLPFSAGAVTIRDISPSSPGAAYGNDGSVTSLTVGDTEAVIMTQGTGIVISKPASGTNVGLTVPNNLIIGQDNPGSTGGDLFIGVGTKPDFTIQSDGKVSVGALLQVLDGRTLGITTKTTETLIDASFGSIDAVGALNIQNIDKFISGNIDSETALTISANTITAGAINVVGGTTDIDATGALVMEQFQTNGTTTTIDAASIESGNIQNNGANGEMTITLAGNLTTLNKAATPGSANIGSIENSGKLMKFTAGDVNVAGTLKNDAADGAGTLTMNVDSLIVTGGSESNRSFVNSGNLNLTVAGETNLAYGFDLSAMGTGNTFYLKTGTLKFGNTDAADAWLQVFANKLNDFHLEITGGDVTAGAIINGVADGAGQINTNATMTVIGQSIYATGVSNNATFNPGTAADGSDKTGYLLIKTPENATGDIHIATYTDTDGNTAGGMVQGAVGSKTDIESANGLTVDGAVSNKGTMALNGKTVNLAKVSNAGDLEILAPTDENGQITISGTVTNNDGNLTINARQIDIDDIVTNVAGTTTVKGSDTSGGAVTLGGIDVQGGAFNLDALIGSASVDNAISVTGGALNIGQNTYSLTAGAAIAISGDVSLQAAAPTNGAGDVNIAATGTPVVLSSTNGSISIDGNVSATDSLVARSAQFDAETITVGTDAADTETGNVTVANSGQLIFGSEGRASQTTITGNVTANNGGKLEFWSDDTDVGSLSGNGLFMVHGTQITANAGAIDIDGNLLFSTTDTSITSGMVVNGTNSLTLETSTASSDDILFTGGINLTAGNTLTLKSARDVTIGKMVTDNGDFSAILFGALSVDAAHDVTFNNAIQTSNSLTVTGQDIKTQDITNTGAVKIDGATVTTGAIKSTAGTFDVIAADSLNATSIAVSGGMATLNAKTINVTNDITVSGDLFQGTVSASDFGMLNIVKNGVVSAKNLTVDGAFNALKNSVGYTLSGNVTVDGVFDVANGATVTMLLKNEDTTDDTLGNMTIGALTNNGALNLVMNGTSGLTIDGAIKNTGDLTLAVVNGMVTADSFVDNTGMVTLMGKGMTLSGAFGLEDMPADDTLDTLSMLYHGGTQTLSAGDFYIANSGYTLTASNVVLAGIEQAASTTGLTINTSDLKIAKDINVTDMRVAANPSDDWLKVDVGGSVLGGAQFIGLESMYVGGNYKFTNNSQINAAILPYATGDVPNTTTNNYWSSISLNDDNTLGQITNKADGAALIQVKGAFLSSANAFNVATNGGVLGKPQVGLVLRDTVDPGTAIWLLHAKEGVSDEDWTAKIRNLNVSFCNADGSECFDYLGSLKDYNGSNPKVDLPVYISVRDSAGDGFADSLYVVFDPRFGGPVEVFKIQPIVARTDDYTSGEYGTAGAIDNLIAGKLADSGFRNRTPIEAIPLVFKNTNMSTAANELYNRMEQYDLGRDGTALARFSRLFQPREVEQIAGSIVLNEHTNFRSFEDRMFDEFIWNRNRNLKKAWLDIDYGMFYQDVTDGKRVDGNRFNISGGFDWQESQTLLLGLTGRVSHMSADNSDSMDLGYLPGQHIAGNVQTKVADTDIGLGGYLMKILGQKTRVYGNGFLDIHVLDVDRDQTYVSKISGSGTAFSLTSEWGLLHDWLNQYVVGNMYARVGYNFGFDVTEKAAGQDYMKLKSDGYFIFTPGYSLTAQKRIYPSVWFQVRPYATIGVEYDVLGAPDSVKYKFAPANSYTTYDVDIDPLWASIGGGVEMLSVTGIQVGIDYRYQYNHDIQLHNIRVSGSYRF